MIDVSIRLRRAIFLGDLALVRRIIKNYPAYLQNPDLADAGNTSLHLAARLGLVDIAVRQKKGGKKQKYNGIIFFVFDDIFFIAFGFDLILRNNSAFFHFCICGYFPGFFFFPFFPTLEKENVFSKDKGLMFGSLNFCLLRPRD
jgi:hypothetical protein